MSFKNYFKLQFKSLDFRNLIDFYFFLIPNQVKLSLSLTAYFSLQLEFVKREKEAL